MHWTLVCWISTGGGEYNQDTLPTQKLLCRNSSGISMAITHQLQKMFISTVFYAKARNRKTFCLCFKASLAEHGLSFYLLIHCSDTNLLCLPRPKKSKWKFTLLSPQYILNSPRCSEGCSSNQWLHWSLLTLHTCKEIRSEHEIIFNRRFCMVSRSL